MDKDTGPDKREPQTIDGATGTVDPTPTKPRRRIDLSNLRDVRLELANVYRMVDAGELDHADATKRAYVLTAIGKVIEAEQIEARIEALEERANGGIPKALPQPHATH